MKSLFFSFLFLLHLVCSSQNQFNPVTWKAVYTDKNDSEGEITFTATIEDKWHIYSQRPTDAGPVPTSFTVTTNSNFQLVGKVSEQDAHEEFVKAFDAKIFLFAKKAVFTQTIKRKGKKAFTIKASLEYMTCNDMQCLPPKVVDFVISVPALKKSKAPSSTDIQISILTN